MKSVHCAHASDLHLAELWGLYSELGWRMHCSSPCHFVPIIHCMHVNAPAEYCKVYSLVIAGI